MLYVEVERKINYSLTFLWYANCVRYTLSEVKKKDVVLLVINYELLSPTRAANGNTDWRNNSNSSFAKSSVIVMIYRIDGSRASSSKKINQIAIEVVNVRNIEMPSKSAIAAFQKEWVSENTSSGRRSTGLVGNFVG